MITPLSTRVASWLCTLRLRRTRDSFDKDATKTWLRQRSRPSWDAVVDVELAFGGVIGKGDDGGLVAFGVHDWFGRTAVVAGRVCVLVGFCDPVSVFVDEHGGVVEVDEAGNVTVAADSLAQRLEQRALEVWSAWRYVDVAVGRRGAAWAAALGLVPLIEACDEHQQWWASERATPTSTAALLLRQAKDDDDGWRTFLSSGDPVVLDTAIDCLSS